MISSIFGKTKPINYVIVITFLFVFYWFVHLFLFNEAYSSEQLSFKFIGLSVLLFSIFVVNFVIKRNKMTEANSFAILFFALLLLIFPETLTDNNAILGSFFLLLATRRLISMRSLRNIKLKVFDATLWVLFSSLFYDWALLYLLLVFAAVYIYEPKNIRNWLAPFAGIFTFFMIAYALLLLANNRTFLMEHYLFDFGFKVDYFLNWGSNAKLIIYVLLIFLTTIYSFLKLGKSGLGKIVTMRLIVISFLIGIFVNLLGSSPNDHPIMVTFFPAVVFMTNYVESIKRPNIKEIVLMASIIVPFLVLIAGIIVK